MQLFAWLQKWIGANQPPTGWRTRRPAQRCRPRLETLEGRCLPSTLYVTSPLDDGSRGTLRYDIARAASGDTIEMSPTLTAPIVLTQGELLLKKNLTIEGQANQPETISGNNSNNSSRVFEVAAGAVVTLMNLNITGGDGVANNPGHATGNAGGGGGSSGNDGLGGGVLNTGTLTVSNCTLSGNSVNANPLSEVALGGAIYNTGTLTVSNCTLSGNSAGEGGGIYNYGGTVTVSNSTLSGNSAILHGGALFSRVVAARAPDGVIVFLGTMTVSNSSFSSNSPDNIYGVIDGGGNTGLP